MRMEMRHLLSIEVATIFWTSDLYASIVQHDGMIDSFNTCMQKLKCISKASACQVYYFILAKLTQYTVFYKTKTKCPYFLCYYTCAFADHMFYTLTIIISKGRWIILLPHAVAYLWNFPLVFDSKMSGNVAFEHGGTTWDNGLVWRSSLQSTWKQEAEDKGKYMQLIILILDWFHYILQLFDILSNLFKKPKLLNENYTNFSL